MTEEFNITEGWIEMSAQCHKCGKIVSALADPDRLDKYAALQDSVEYWGGPYFIAIDTWTESTQWYRELMIAAATDPDGQHYSMEDYYCDKCFNPTYLGGVDDVDCFKSHYRTKVFMESMEAESQGSTRWNFETLNKATREWRLKLWDQATEQVYGKSRQGMR